MQEVYKSLSEVTFIGDDSKNPYTWAGIDQINEFLNQAIIHNQGVLAYYIGPTNSSYEDKLGIEDIAKHICKRQGNQHTRPLNDHYKSDELDKPFIVIANTQTVLAQSSTDTTKSGGSHWISWVLLPKKYHAPFQTSSIIDRYQLFFFDSLARYHFPKELKAFLLQGAQIIEKTDTGNVQINLLPFCKENEIDFVDGSHVTGHQKSMNGSDCGWWAIYYALMTVYTGGISFLEPIKGKMLSAVTLRSIMMLDELKEEIKKNTGTNTANANFTGSSSLIGHGEHAAAGLKLTLHGNVYQLKLLMLFLKLGVDNGYEFKLTTEMHEAEKFDDVVFKYKNKVGNENQKYKYRFLQAKHKQDESNKITDKDLLTEKDDEFSLQKYFISYQRIKEKFKDGLCEDFIICTNINFDFDGDSGNRRILKLKSAFETVNDDDAIFNASLNEKSQKKSVRYKFKNQFPGKNELLVPVLKLTSDLVRLARKLADCALNNKKLSLKDEIFKIYHGALMQEVIDIKDKKFKAKFLDNKNLSNTAVKFRNAFICEAFKLKKISELKITDDAQKSLLKELYVKNLEISSSFGIVFKSDINPQITDINEFSNKFIKLLKDADEDVIKIQKRENIVKNNINKLAGHVLVFNENKEICLSTAFLNERSLPGNLAIFRAELKKKLPKNILFEELDCYRFKINKFNTVREDQLNLKSTLPDDEISNTEIEEFLKHLVFAVNQPNEVDLAEIINNKIGDELNLIDSDFVFSEFQRSMLDWMKARKGRFLSNEDAAAFFEKAKHKLAGLIMIGPTLEYRAILDKSTIKFTNTTNSDMLKTFLNSSSEKNILNFMAPQTTYLSSVKIYQFLKDLSEWSKDDSYVFIRLDSGINLQERLVNAFSGKTNLIVIECNLELKSAEVQSLFGKLFTVANKNPTKKIILITSQSNILNSSLRKDTKYHEIADQENSLTDLSEDSKNSLKNKSINFQNQEMKLHEIISDGNLDKVVNSAALLELVSANTVNIGNSVCKLNDFELACYRKRIFNRKVIVDKQCFKENFSDLFVVTGINKKDLSEFIPEVEKIRLFDDAVVDKNKPERFIVLSEDNAEVEFNLLKIEYFTYAIHWLNLNNNQISWQQSHGSLAGLRRYIIDDNFQEFNQDKISDKFNIIAAEPGMGKSSVVTYLADHIKTNNQSSWIIKINLLEYKEIIKSTTFTNISDVADFIARVEQLAALAKNILAYRLEVEGKIELFFDGFDEISSELQIKIIQLLRILKNSAKTESVWVTTRLNIKDKLEDALGIFAYSLKSFSAEDKIIFLRDFWQKSLGLNDQILIEKKRFEIYANDLLKTFASSTHDKLLEFVGIPLQAVMLAEAFQADFAIYYSSQYNEPELPKNLDLVDLYKRFADNKYDIYFKEKAKIDYFSQSLRQVTIKSLTKMHQYLAFSFLFSEYLKDFFAEKINFNFTEDELKQIGIIQHIDGKLMFVHRTFAEYFVADLLANLLEKSINHPIYSQVRSFLLQEIFKARNQIIYSFLEKIVQKRANKNLAQAWQTICDSSLFSTVDENSEHKISIVDYGETEAASKVKTLKNINELLEKLDVYSSSKAYRTVDSFFNKFFKVALQENNIDKVTEILRRLSELGEKTTLNKAKQHILENIPHLIKHYLSLKFYYANSSDEVSIDYGLITDFAKITAYNSSEDPGQQIAERVDKSLKQYKKQLIVYNNFKKLVKEQPDITVDFLDKLKSSKILYLRVKKGLILNVNELEYLKIAYRNWSSDDNFRELFLRLNKDEVEAANAVKEFLIAEKDWILLLKLFNKFPNLKLNKENIEVIYRDEDLFFLERAGIDIAFNLKLLTPKMVEGFKLPLFADPINGYHSRYAYNILNKLILPFLNIMQLRNARGINKLALIEICISFLTFSLDHELSLSLSTKQVQVLLDAVVNILNNSLISGEMLSASIKCLLIISKGLRLKLISTENEILVLEPVSQFVYKMSLIHKEKIVIALKSSQENLEKICKEIMLEISAVSSGKLKFHELKSDGRLNKKSKYEHNLAFFSPANLDSVKRQSHDNEAASVSAKKHKMVE